MTEREKEIFESLRGGQLWEQSRFPYFRRFIIYGKDCFIFASTNPISMAATDETGKWLYTPEEAAIHLAEYDYKLQDESSTDMHILYGRLDLAKAEIERLKERCPYCYQLSLKSCNCPIDGPGEGASCSNCGMTHMDPPPRVEIERLTAVVDADNKALDVLDNNHESFIGGYQAAQGARRRMHSAREVAGAARKEK